MKTSYFKILTVGAIAASIILSTFTASAQDSSATSTAVTTQPAATPPLAYGVSQILQLSQAKVGDDTIIAYIKNSGNSYGLNADQIIYLRQQGLSTGVLNAMLSQPTPGVMASTAPAVAMPSTPAPAATYSQPAYPSSSMIGPSVTAIDPTAAAAASTTYVYYQQPYYYPAYSYPSYYYPSVGYYGCYPGVSLSFGWRGGWGPGWGWRGGGWGGGFRGGFHGGWHR